MPGFQRLCTLAIVMPLAAGAACGQDPAVDDVAKQVPDGVVRAADLEAAALGTIETKKGCRERTAGDLLAKQRARQAAYPDTPVDGWLIEAPGDAIVYVCGYTGKFSRSEHGHKPKVNVLIPADPGAIKFAPSVEIQFDDDSDNPS